MLTRLALFAISTFLSASCHKKDSPPTERQDMSPVEITSKVLVKDLNFPWEILWGNDNMIWMTERTGKISRINPSSGEVTPVATINEVKPNGEGGLLGMVLYPAEGIPQNVFVAYDYDKNGSYTGKVVRYDYQNGTISNPKVIIDGFDAAGIHNGCRLAISHDDKLFITTGDASDQSHPQDLKSLNGKVLRVNPDGTIPADNPDPSSAVWSYGHRNPQGLVFVNGILFSSEHGPDSDDEINIIEKGGNYGWPNVRGMCNESDERTFCNENSIVEPLINWTPTIAVCGIDYYNSDTIPQWKNSILMCTLKDERLIQLKLPGDHKVVGESKEYFVNEYGRLRDVCVSPDGRVFLCTSNGGNADVVVEVGKGT